MPSSAESMPLRRMSSTFSTPACPLAARPRRYTTPIITARAPSASALTTSEPRRIPAVHQHLDLVPHRVRDRLHHPDSGRGAVQVVAAVVGNRDRRDPRVHRPPRVVDPAHPLQHEGATVQLRPLLPRIHATSSHDGGGVVIHS